MRKYKLSFFTESRISYCYLRFFLTFASLKNHTMSTQINSYIEANKDRFLNELLDLLRMPSVSADPKYKNDVLKTADALKEKLISAGADKVEICPTPGYPIVYGEKFVSPSLPTVLAFGHYDVQPADPLNLWTSPPFEPVI